MTPKERDDLLEWLDALAPSNIARISKLRELLANYHREKGSNELISQLDQATLVWLLDVMLEAEGQKKLEVVVPSKVRMPLSHIHRSADDFDMDFWI